MLFNIITGNMPVTRSPLAAYSALFTVCISPSPPTSAHYRREYVHELRKHGRPINSCQDNLLSPIGPSGFLTDGIVCFVLDGVPKNLGRDIEPANDVVPERLDRIDRSPRNSPPSEKQ